MSKPIVIGTGNKAAPNVGTVIVIGDNNELGGVFDKTAYINCHEQQLTNSDGENDGKTFFNDGAMSIDGDGVATLVPAPKKLGVNGGSTITSGTGESIYYCDATSGNISITINHTDIVKTFVRLDNSVNTVTLTPASGLINGLGSYGLNTQYEKITVLSYNSNLYF